MTGHPPKNIEELRQIYSNIKKEKKEKLFGVRSLNILKTMLDKPNESAVKSSSEIAQEQGTNTSTVTRLAQKLGFKGFPSFQAIFQQQLTQGQHYYSGQVEKFLQATYSNNESPTHILEQITQEEWGNVMMMLEYFDPDKFVAATHMIIEAENIYILGLRGSYPLAFYLGLYLKLIRGNVTTLGNAGRTLAEDLATFKPGDLLFAISVRPYTKETISACRIARQQKMDLITLTDSHSSPLAAETENNLIISAKGDYFFSPMTAAIIYIEALLSEVVKVLGDNAIPKLKHLENLLTKLEIEM